jgi:GNAT superfamily N-acetyltransferase
MAFTYRLAEIDDIDELVRLRTLMQFEVNDPDFENVPTEFSQKVRRYFLKSIPARQYHSPVAVFENKIVANAGVIFYEKPPTIYGGSGVIGYVTNVYTERKFRGRGIGTQLMRELSALALKVGADKLHLGATSDGLSLYKTVGYTEPRFVNLEIRNPFSFSESVSR